MAVVAAVAAQEAVDSHERPDEYTVFCQGEFGVFRAGGIEHAAWSVLARDKQLIETKGRKAGHLQFVCPVFQIQAGLIRNTFGLLLAPAASYECKIGPCIRMGVRHGYKHEPDNRGNEQWGFELHHFHRSVRSATLTSTSTTGFPMTPAPETSRLITNGHTPRFP